MNIEKPHEGTQGKRHELDHFGSNLGRDGVVMSGQQIAQDIFYSIRRIHGKNSRDIDGETGGRVSWSEREDVAGVAILLQRSKVFETVRESHSLSSRGSGPVYGIFNDQSVGVGGSMKQKKNPAKAGQGHKAGCMKQWMCNGAFFTEWAGSQAQNTATGKVRL